MPYGRRRSGSRERDAILDVDIGIGYGFDQCVEYRYAEGGPLDETECVKCARMFAKRKLCTESLLCAGRGERPDTGTVTASLEQRQAVRNKAKNARNAIISHLVDLHDR
jgi:hypothetical protein